MRGFAPLTLSAGYLTKEMVRGSVVKRGGGVIVIQLAISLLLRVLAPPALNPQHLAAASRAGAARSQSTASRCCFACWRRPLSIHSISLLLRVLAPPALNPQHLAAASRAGAARSQSTASRCCFACWRRPLSIHSISLLLRVLAPPALNPQHLAAASRAGAARSQSTASRCAAKN